MNEPSIVKDVLLWCLDCGREFIFTAGEAAFFQERGFVRPKRCKPCREITRQRLHPEDREASRGT